VPSRSIQTALPIINFDYEEYKLDDQKKTKINNICRSYETVSRDYNMQFELIVYSVNCSLNYNKKISGLRIKHVVKYCMKSFPSAKIIIKEDVVSEDWLCSENGISIEHSGKFNNTNSIR
jgi:hypothetical protein